MLQKINKLIDAKSRTDRLKCSLALYEGDSAITSFRTYRDADLMGAFPLRGKFINVNGMKSTDIIKKCRSKIYYRCNGIKNW